MVLRRIFHFAVVAIRFVRGSFCHVVQITHEFFYKKAISHHESGNRHKWGVINYNKDKNMRERLENKGDRLVASEIAKIEEVRLSKIV